MLINQLMKSKHNNTVMTYFDTDAVVCLGNTEDYMKNTDDQLAASALNY